MVAVLAAETPNTTQVPFGCSMPSAAPSAVPPTESRINQNGPCGLAAASSRTDDDAFAAPFGHRGTVFIAPDMPPHKGASRPCELASEVSDPARGAVDQHL